MKLGIAMRTEVLMKAFFLNLLYMAIKGLIGFTVWTLVQKAVTDLMDTTLSGDEKRAMALADLKAAFANVPVSMLNLAIEAAVAQQKAS